jgi:hypothetical protein
MKNIELIVMCLLSAITAIPARAQAPNGQEKKAPAEQNGLFGGQSFNAEERDAKALNEAYAEAVRREKLAQDAYEIAWKETLLLRNDIRNKTGKVDISHNSLEATASKLDRDLEALQLEEVGSEARMKALEDAVATQARRVEKASQADPVIAELEKVADARERQLKIVENERKTGVVPDAALQDAIAALAEARAKTAERRQAVFVTNGGDTLGALNRELLNLSIADHERRAKLEFLESQLHKITPMLDSSSQLQFQERELSEAMNELQAARQNVRQCQLWVSEHPSKPAQPQTRPSKSKADGNS